MTLQRIHFAIGKKFDVYVVVLWDSINAHFINPKYQIQLGNVWEIAYIQ